uniref:Transcription activation suppressor b n=1 Tax=Sphaeramia orbicularis TaxID=375764 RepID=A0A673ACK9_9TELE
MLPHTPIAAFSQYVSFHHPCPPVQGYINSLQDNISNMLTQFEEHHPPLRNNVVDATLASSVSAFVASIRAANDDQNGTAADEPPPNNPLSTPHQVAVSDPNVVSVCNEPSQQCRSPQQRHHSSESSRTVSCIIRQTEDDSSSEGAAAVEAVAFSGAQAGSGSGSGSAPPTTDLSSLISQLQPEVFTSLEEIINDVRKNSLQFYVHSTEEQDPMDADVKEYLLKQGNMEQSPAAFLNQDNSTNRLLVVIKNKDVARHVHQIPGLVSLKHHHSVVFVGIDKLDDIRNNSYNELFVSGGCVISDELVLNPDFISHDQLTSLLKAVEKQSSPESVWRWKVHCKTHKKLKEQARFRRDAASLLDVLSAYQKRQIVEFLPYHRCDMMTHQSPDLDCLLELQARYTQYRHTVFLTERRIDFSQWGIIVASVDELQHNFSRLIGYHDNKDRQLITDDLQEPKGQPPPLPSSDLPQGLPLWSSPAVPHAPHLLDQLVPESSPAASSSKDGLLLHSDSDMEFLHQAISQLRAQRQAQAQLIQSQVLELDAQPLTSRNKEGLLEKKAYACTPPSGLRGTPTVKKAVAATLELIHSALQPEPEPEPEPEIKEDNQTTGPLVSPSVRSPSPLSNHRPATLTQACDSNSANERRDGRDPTDQATACSSSSSSLTEGDRGRASESHQSDGANATLTGSVTMVTDQEDTPASALPRLHPQHQLRHPQRGSGLMYPPHLPLIHNHPFPHRAMLGGMRGLLGPAAPGWPGPLQHTALVWTLPSRFHPPAGPGSTYRGQSRGGFNGM